MLTIQEKTLSDQLHVSTVTNEEMKEIVSDYHEGDITVLHDAHLSSLIETLQNNGFSDDLILHLTKNMYGDFLELFWNDEIEQYVMIIGVR